MSGQKVWYQLVENFLLIFIQKIKFITHLFVTILLRYCKLIILGNLTMLGDIHQKQWYQIVRNFDVYLHAKNQLDPSLLF